MTPRGLISVLDTASVIAAVDLRPRLPDHERVKAFLYTLLCVWTFAVLPTYAAWLGAGPGSVMSALAQPTSENASEACNAPCCVPALHAESAGCCSSLAVVDAVEQHPSCPVPSENEEPCCPCCTPPVAVGLLMAFIAIDHTADWRVAISVRSAPRADHSATRALRIPVPPPRIVV